MHNSVCIKKDILYRYIYISGTYICKCIDIFGQMRINLLVGVTLEEWD